MTTPKVTPPPKRTVPLLPAEKAAILIAHGAGATHKALALQYNVSTKTIQRALAEPTESRIGGPEVRELQEWQDQAQAALAAVDLGVPPMPLAVRPDHQVPGANLAPLSVPASTMTLHHAVEQALQDMVPRLAAEPTAENVKALTELYKVTIAIRLACVTWGISFEEFAKGGGSVRSGGNDPALRSAGETIEASGETLD